MRKQGDLNFKQTDMERSIRAHRAMGIEVVIEVMPDGTLRPIPLKPMAEASKTPANEWDKALGKSPAKVRSPRS